MQARLPLKLSRLRDIAAILITTALTICVESAQAAEFCGLKVGPFAAMLDQVRRNPAFQSIGGSTGYVGFADMRAQRYMVFTRSGNPAHPSVACRRPELRNGAWSVTTNVLCGASDTKCRRLITEFNALDEQMAKSIKQKH